MGAAHEEDDVAGWENKVMRSIWYNVEEAYC
jgi:hypothetical protein